MKKMKKMLSMLIVMVLVIGMSPISAFASSCYGWAECAETMRSYDFFFAGSPFYYEDYMVAYKPNNAEGKIEINPEEVTYKLGNKVIYNGYIFTTADDGKYLTATWKGQKTTPHKLRGVHQYAGMRYDMVSEPTKKNYSVGETFDSSGFVAKYKQSNLEVNKEKTLGPNDVTFKAYLSFKSPASGTEMPKGLYELIDGKTPFTNPGSYRIVAEYQRVPGEKVGESFVINVADKGKASLSIESKPDQLDYVLGEGFNTDGFSAIYTKDGASKKLTAKDVEFKSGSVITHGRPFEVEGDKTVTVSYEGAKATFKIAVVKERVSSVITPPTKTTYYVGDPFDTTGFSLTYTDSKGTKKLGASDVKFKSGSVITHGRPFEQAGTKKVEMTYGSAYENFTIKVLPASEKPKGTETEPTTPQTNGGMAAATSSKVMVNGKNVAFDAYNINNNNYFKLRDLAQALNGSAKQFEVTFDNSKNAVNLVPNKAYTTVGGELVAGGGVSKKASISKATLYLEGKPVEMAAYLIDGNNYFKLRDVMQKLDAYVGWDGAQSLITIDTSKSYVQE